MRIATRPVADEKLLAPSGERMWRLGAKRLVGAGEGRVSAWPLFPLIQLLPGGVKVYVALALLAAQD
jgi:hypothetical protein